MSDLFFNDFLIGQAVLSVSLIQSRSEHSWIADPINLVCDGSMNLADLSAKHIANASPLTFSKIILSPDNVSSFLLCLNPTTSVSASKVMASPDDDPPIRPR